MLLMRPIKTSDLDSLMQLLASSGYGLTSLPKDPEVLLSRIEKSEFSFQQKNKNSPGGEIYLFVMEDIFRGEIVGVSGLISKIGGFEPYFFYELKSCEHYSEQINVKHTVHSLHLHKTHSGPAEICSLFLSPQHRNAHNGRLLSLSRFLFIAEHVNSFEKEIIAEMRGMVDDTGHSPFFEAVGKKFLQIPFPEADFLTMKNKSFIEELLPKDAIIVELLPNDAQYVVGKVHPQTEPAKKILEKEGFSFCNLVGIFEPGPVLKAKVSNIRTIRESEVGDVVEIKNSNDIAENGTYLISNRQSMSFRCCVGDIEKKDQGYIISDVTATALKLRIGESIRVVKL